MAATLNTVWQNQLSGEGTDVVSVLYYNNSLYVGTNGYIQALDPDTGAQQAYNGLSGYGHEEIRMAMSVDGSVLLVGTNSYAIGLNPADLSQVWNCELDNGGDIVSVLAAEVNGTSTAFFASDGYIYSFNASSGASLGSNGLSGCGTDEVRMDISLDNSILYIGTDGYAVGLQASNISNTLWNNDLPDMGHGITSVLTGGAISGQNVVYYGVNGYVAILTESGTILNTANIGDDEVRLSLNEDATVLAAGMDGYIYSLEPATLAVVGSYSVEGSSVVTPLAIQDVIYVGSDGYVYEFSSNCNILASNNLQGLGYNEIRITADEDFEYLWVGTDGQALALALDDYSSNLGPWMGQLNGDMLLRNVAIPGTHDSGTYGITPFSPIGEDLPSYVPVIQGLVGPLGLAANPVIALWSIAQGQTFYQQLVGGIRYFDLRLQYANGAFNFVHGLVGAPLSDLTTMVTQFLAQPGFGNEIIILDFQHVFNISGSAVTDLMTTLTDSFSTLMIPSSMGTGASLSDIWNTSGRLVVLYPDDTVVANYDFLWSRTTSIEDVWPDDQTLTDLYNDLNAQLPYTGSELFVLQGVITPNASLITSGILGSGPGSLLALAQQTNPNLNSWISSNWASQTLNIVISDWYGLTNFAATVIANNTGRTSAATNSQPPAITQVQKAMVDCRTKEEWRRIEGDKKKAHQATPVQELM